MLQQTQAARVEPAFEAFVQRFPDVGSLAGASRADVITAWGTLGYNRRAVALHDAARSIVREHRGKVPRDTGALRRLAGVGPYTAAAVASIGFGDAVPALDTNVRRVVARVVLGADPSVVAPDALHDAASCWLDRSAPADWNQGVMDLGRTFCRPAPRCGPCPLASVCRFTRSGARPGAAPRRQAPFEGSDRQVRGAIVRALRAGRSMDAEGLARAIAHDPARVAALLPRLVIEGLVDRTRSGRLRLPRR
jgi:A/G-specific adenine glycosylase